MINEKKACILLILKGWSDGWSIPGQHMLTGVLWPVTGCLVTLHQVLHWPAGHVITYLINDHTQKPSWVGQILVLKIAQRKYKLRF